MNCTCDHGFIPGPDKIVDGKSYPTLEACPDCAVMNASRTSAPKFAKPKVEKTADRRRPKHRNLQSDASDWIRLHPLAAEKMLTVAKELAGLGRHFGISLLVEQVRYCGIRDAWQEGDYKINNSHRAYIARWIIQQAPGVEGHMEFREAKWA